MATLGVKNASASMTVTPQLTVTSDSLRVREGSSDAVSSSAATCSAVYEVAGSSQITSLSSAQTTAAATYNVGGNITSTSSVTAIGQITAGGGSTATGHATMTASARYKWLDASDPTTSWTEADYLERAA